MAKARPGRRGEEVLTLLNKERSTAGLKPLKGNTKLAGPSSVARKLADADSLDSGPISPRDQQSGYSFRRIAKLAASGLPTEEVVKSWMGNEADRKNVLAEFTEVGVGYARTAEDKPFWCLFLARPLRR